MTVNQCDGCRRGLPITDGIHKGQGYDYIACTKDLYKDKPTMNYDECSDFEINKAVALTMTKCVSMRIVGESEKFNYLEMKVGIEFNPCNNPSDAWPIITENRISICHGVQTNAVSAQDGFGNHYTKIEDVTKGLRAACIVYLTMMEK